MLRFFLHLSVIFDGILYFILESVFSILIDGRDTYVIFLFFPHVVSELFRIRADILPSQSISLHKLSIKLLL